MLPAVSRVSRTAWRAVGASEGDRAIPEETAVAFTYNGGSYAVMMATPQDLEDFALGFSLTEGIIASPDEIERLEIIEEPVGIELRMWLAEPPCRHLRRAAALSGRADRLRPVRHREPDRGHARACRSWAAARAFRRPTSWRRSSR